MTIRAVVFDWGGTLTPWRDVDLLSRWLDFARVYAPERAQDLAEGLLHSEQSRWGRMFETAGESGTGALAMMFADNGVDASGDLFDAALRTYLDSWEPNTWTDPDAAPLLEGLRAAGLKTAVLSNTMWPRWHHEAVLERDGVLHLFDYLLFSSETPTAKPHRDVFLDVAGNLGVGAHECVFVGDRLFDDISGAQRVGMRGIWIPHSNLADDQAAAVGVVPDAVAHRLADVATIVETWSADA